MFLSDWIYNEGGNQYILQHDKMVSHGIIAHGLEHIVYALQLTGRGDMTNYILNVAILCSILATWRGRGNSTVGSVSVCHAVRPGLRPVRSACFRKVVCC